MAGPESGGTDAAGRRDERQLPPFTVRRSRRARHARITVSPRRGVVVVVPEAWTGFDAAGAVEERLDWVLAARERYAPLSPGWGAGPEMLVPERVVLAATGESWCVDRRATGSAHVRVIERDGVLTLSGCAHDAAANLLALQRWLSAAGRARLVPWLGRLASDTGLEPERVTVRAQQTRWGSCSSRRAIALNRALLFLPPDHVEGVMLHELAHLEHPDHSARFWNRLSALDPAWRERRAAIRGAWRRVPAWAEWRPE